MTVHRILTLPALNAYCKRTILEVVTDILQLVWSSMMLSADEVPDIHRSRVYTFAKRHSTTSSGPPRLSDAKRVTPSQLPLLPLLSYGSRENKRPPKQGVYRSKGSTCCRQHKKGTKNYCAQKIHLDQTGSLTQGSRIWSSSPTSLSNQLHPIHRI